MRDHTLLMNFVLHVRFNNVLHPGPTLSSSAVMHSIITIKTSIQILLQLTPWNYFKPILCTFSGLCNRLLNASSHRPHTLLFGVRPFEGAVIAVCLREAERWNDLPPSTTALWVCTRHCDSGSCHSRQMIYVHIFFSGKSGQAEEVVRNCAAGLGFVLTLIWNYSIYWTGNGCCTSLVQSPLLSVTSGFFLQLTEGERGTFLWVSL